MNNLPKQKQVEAIAALCEGVSVRATERLTGVNRGTILSLGVRVGDGCAVLHDAMMRGLHVSRIELDEAWSFVAKKQRNGENCRAFLADLRARVLGAPEISSDGFPAYPDAVERAFGVECTFGTIEKHYAVETAGVEAARRYSPAAVVSVTTTDVVGSPSRISTSYIERQNLTLRMQQRRFTRLTNAFSKKLDNHVAAVALYVAHYNFCRVHEALRVTPAMQLGVTDHIWTIGELVDAALEGVWPALRSIHRDRWGPGVSEWPTLNREWPN